MSSVQPDKGRKPRKQGEVQAMDSNLVTKKQSHHHWSRLPITYHMQPDSYRANFKAASTRRLPETSQLAFLKAPRAPTNNESKSFIVLKDKCWDSA
jgi:hypothetical protein